MRENIGIDINNLIREAQTGNKKAMEEIIKRYTPFVVKTSRRIYIRGYEVRDLIQIGQVSIIKAVNSYNLNRDKGFTTYVSNAVKFNYYSLIRDKVKLLSECSIDSINIIGKDGIKALVSQNNVEDEILAKEERLTLYTGIERLSKGEREIITWFYFKNKTLEEYARKKEIGYRTVIERKRVAVKKLQYLMSVKLNSL